MLNLGPRKRRYLLVALLFILAFSLRFYAINNTVVDAPLRADAGDYYLYALNLKKHGVYSRAQSSTSVPAPDALRTPGYPAFLMPFITDPPNLKAIWRITFVQALLDSITVLLALAVFRHFMLESWAAGAALLVAISPHMISATTYVLTETLFTFLMILSIWLLLKSASKRKNTLIIATGIVLALAALTKPTLQYFIIPVIGLIIYQYGWRSTLRFTILLFVGFSIIFSIWIFRNVSSTGAVSDKTLTINTLHHGMYPDFKYKGILATHGFPYRYDPNSAHISQSTKTVITEIIRRFKEEPYRHIKWYMFGKPITLLSWNLIAGMGDVFIYPIRKSPYLSSPIFSATHFLMKRTHWLLVILALLASVAVWIPVCARRISSESLFAARVLSLLIFYFIAVHVVGAPFPRYGIPMRPVIYGLAMLFCSQYYNYVMEMRNKKLNNNDKR